MSLLTELIHYCNIVFPVELLPHCRCTGSTTVNTEISLWATQELWGLLGRSLNAIKYSKKSIFRPQIQQLHTSATSCSTTRKLGLSWDTSHLGCSYFTPTVTSSSVHLSYFSSSTSKHCYLTFFWPLEFRHDALRLGSLQWLPITLNKIQDTLVLGIQCWTSTSLIKPHSPCQAATIGHYQLPSSSIPYMKHSHLSRSRISILVYLNHIIV